jgi:hypothetical protein
LYSVRDSEIKRNLCRNIEETVDKPRHLSRAVLDIFIRALGEGDIGVLVVEAVVLGQDVLLVVPLKGLPQLHVGDGVALLGVGDFLHFLVETSEFLLQITRFFISLSKKRFPTSVSNATIREIYLYMNTNPQFSLINEDQDSSLNLSFLIKNCYFPIALGLHKGRPSYRRSLQSSKEKIQHFKNMDR